MTFNMKKENFRGIGIGMWRLPFCFYSLLPNRRRTQEKAWKPRILLLKEIPE